MTATATKLAPGRQASHSLSSPAQSFAFLFAQNMRSCAEAAQAQTGDLMSGDFFTKAYLGADRQMRAAAAAGPDNQDRVLTSFLDSLASKQLAEGLEHLNAIGLGKSPVAVHARSIHSLMIQHLAQERTLSQVGLQPVQPEAATR